MDLRTTQISNEALRGELDFVVDFFVSRSIGNTCVMLGIGCGIPGDEMYQEIPVPPNKLSEFIQAQIASKVYHLGNDDLVILDSTMNIEFTFCHEHDIHCVSDDETLMGLISARWSQLGFDTYVAAKK